MSLRGLSAAEHAHLMNAARYVDEAAHHHGAAVAAHDKADDRALAEAHRDLGRCLRAAQDSFGDLAAEGAAADIKNTQTIQTSSGTAPSTGSAGGRGSSGFQFAAVGEQPSRETRLKELAERRYRMPRSFDGQGSALPLSYNDAAGWLARAFGARPRA